MRFKYQPHPAPFPQSVFAFLPHVCVLCHDTVWLEEVWRLRHYYESTALPWFSCVQCDPFGSLVGKWAE